MATRVPLEDVSAETPGYRSSPSNLEAEQALLGAMLVNNEAANLVTAFLLPEHFFLPVHGRIYDAVLRMIERGQIANPVTLKHYFERDEGLEDAGGGQYLARLAGSAVTVINAEHYGRTIHDLALRRALVGVGEEVVNDAYDSPPDQPASEQIETAEHKLYRLAEDGRIDPGGQHFAAPLTQAVHMIELAYKRDSHLTGAPTGLNDLDRLLGGLHPSDLLILAGRPGMGKTALATNIAFNAASRYRPGGGADGTQAIDGAKVAFFSLEMSAEQLATRILAEQTGISSDRLRRGEVRDIDFDRIVQASREMEGLPLFIDDSPALTIAGLRARARRLKRRHGISLIVVDYLQLMRPTTSVRLNNRVQEVTEITQGLKALAKDLNLPVLALSQLSRAVEQRDDKRPQLADLRESGSIEQDADVVMFIYRAQYYLARKEPDVEDAASHADWKEKMDKVHNKAEIIVAKQRHGPTDNIYLYFDAMLTKFDNLDTIHTSPENATY